MDATLLFVDDDRFVREVIKNTFKNEPYEILLATNSDEAFKILEEKKIDVIISDIRMPGMDGIEFLKIVKEKYPLIVRMVLSGYFHIHTVLSAINHGEVYRFLTKPLPLSSQVKEIIHSAVEYARKKRNELDSTLQSVDRILANITVPYIRINPNDEVDRIHLSLLPDIKLGVNLSELPLCEDINVIKKLLHSKKTLPLRRIFNTPQFNAIVTVTTIPTSYGPYILLIQSH